MDMFAAKLTTQSCFPEGKKKEPTSDTFSHKNFRALSDKGMNQGGKASWHSVFLCSFLFISPSRPQGLRKYGP